MFVEKRPICHVIHVVATWAWLVSQVSSLKNMQIDFSLL